ncbi:hypothetical protein F5884DRAFT_863188 [Xylogone sp. PMI_703]|nr:hypothetical protein F5884DRAFT_863188 [Xylogone sp. PMI_703]
MDKQSIILALDSWLNTGNNNLYDQRYSQPWISDSNMLINENLTKISFGRVVERLRSTREISELDLRMTRELLARVKFLYSGTLTRTSVGDLLPSGVRVRPGEAGGRAMANQLTQTAHHGARSILKRILQWLIVQIYDEDFKEDHIHDTGKRLRLWFSKLTREAIRWNGIFVRDVLQFDYLIEAADSGRFRNESRDEARNILHMLRFRFMYAADAVFHDMILGGIVINPNYNANHVAAAAARWARTFTLYTREERFHVPLSRWPLQTDIGYRREHRQAEGTELEDEYYDALDDEEMEIE